MSEITWFCPWGRTSNWSLQRASNLLIGAIGHLLAKPAGALGLDAPQPPRLGRVVADAAGVELVAVAAEHDFAGVAQRDRLGLQVVLQQFAARRRPFRRGADQHRRRADGLDPLRLEIEGAAAARLLA